MTILLLALAARPAAAQINTSVVAATGQTAPGGGTYNRFNFFGPSINPTGQIAFVASLSGGASGVFRSTNGVSTAIARSGQEAPDTGGDTFSGFSVDGDRAVLRDDGDLIFAGSMSGSGLSGLFRSVAGNLSLVTLTEVPAPGFSGVNISTVYSHSARLLNNNRVFTYVDLSDAPDQAIYEANGSTLSLVAAAGLAAPGGGTFINIPTEFTANATGQLAFASELSTSGSYGVFRYQSGGATTAIARTGGTAPGGAGNFFDIALNTPAINAAGQVAFVSSLTGGTSTTGVFRGDGTTTTFIALQGDAAPDTGGRRFGSLDLFPFPDALRLNTGGQVAFLAGLTGDTFGNVGLFRGNGTTTVRIAQRGEVAPGTAGAARFASFGPGSRATVALTDTGRVVFRASVEGVGVTAANDTGLWTGTSAGDLELIAREGQTITVNGQDKTLSAVPFVIEVNSDGVAWQAVFTDNSQAVLYTSFAPVPEPAGLLAAVAALGAVVMVRRPRNGRPL